MLGPAPPPPCVCSSPSLSREASCKHPSRTVTIKQQLPPETAKEHLLQEHKVRRREKQHLRRGAVEIGQQEQGTSSQGGQHRRALLGDQEAGTGSLPTKAVASCKASARETSEAHGKPEDRGLIKHSGPGPEARWGSDQSQARTGGTAQVPQGANDSLPAD